MSRTHTLALVPLLLAAALSGAAFSGLARAQQGSDAPGAPAPGVKPAPWEYRVVALDFTDYSEKDEWKAFSDRNGGNALKADADFRAYVLNYLAHDGWELVQVVFVKDKLSYLYLKRPRTSDALPELPQGDGTQVPQDPKGFPGPDGRPPRKPR